MKRTLPLLGPAVSVLLIWMIVPLAMALWFSLEHYNLLTPGAHAFAGLANYLDLLTGRKLWIAMWKRTPVAGPPSDVSIRVGPISVQVATNGAGTLIVCAPAR
jgi:sorbitol/mannitol transport system permease protein